MDPEPERTGVVERGVDEVGILGEHVLPVANPVVGPARIGQKRIDQPFATVGPGVGEKRPDLLWRGHDPADVKRQPPHERLVVGK